MDRRRNTFRIVSPCPLAAVLLLYGCFSPMTTRLPNFVAGNSRLERQAAQTKDPYPNSITGPDTGFRPLEYQQARAEARQAKDNFFTWVRPQFAPNLNGRASMLNPPWIAAAPPPVYNPLPMQPGPTTVMPRSVPGPGYAYPPSPLPWGAPGTGGPIAVSPAYPLY